jgi:hypothetical protein
MKYIIGFFLISCTIVFIGVPIFICLILKGKLTKNNLKKVYYVLFSR